MVTEACKKYGGFYLGSIGGPAAILAKNCIKKVRLRLVEGSGLVSCAGDRATFVT